MFANEKEEEEDVVVVNKEQDLNEQVKDQRLDSIPDDSDLNKEKSKEIIQDEKNAANLISEEDRKKQLLRSMPTPKIPSFVVLLSSK